MDDMLKMRQTLTSAIFEVFEKMFYVFLEPAERPDGEYLYRVGINFSGPRKGELTALFSHPLAEMMMKNMLNVDGDEMNEPLKEDCLKESVNMICGNFLSKYDSGQVFNLSLPAHTSGKQEVGVTAGRDREALHLDFLSGQGRLMVGVTF